tara:strand:+ start:622 stop:1128 length:507 start_codon:yes stop_codon:yes gene_type:complete
MKKIYSLVASVLLISGCVSGPPLVVLSETAELEFTYDYEMQNTEKSVLWKRARDYFAGAYGDSRAVFRVMDEEEGTIIGKGGASWAISSPVVSIVCVTDYHIRFIAKDNKARLQLKIIEGVPAGSVCTGWPLPSQEGYGKVVQSFNSNSEALKNALSGQGATNDFKDF